MQYYQDIITAKSFKILQNLKRQFNFILIGGWAVFLYTRSLKSKNIDIISDYQLLDKLKEKYDLNKNNRLKKYEIVIDEIDIDIYAPFYSELGIPAEDIGKNTNNVEGFAVPRKEILLILKQIAHNEREGSSKGEKDKIDIISLLNSGGFDFKFYQNVLHAYNLKKYQEGLLTLLNTTAQVKELNLNEYQYSKLKKEVRAQLA